VKEIAAYLARLEPERITTTDAAELFGLFAELTRLGSAGQVLLTPRVAQSDAWRNEGHRSAASWVASATGTGLGDAIAALETGERLQSRRGPQRLSAPARSRAPRCGRSRPPRPAIRRPSSICSRRPPRAR